MEKQQFRAESKRLLDLMINSIYTHKEIFLREIISNASDAVDKLAYKALTDDQVGLNRSDFKITLTPDQIARTLTISDNGIGIEKDKLDKIWKRFYQVNPARSSGEREGAGLGLPMVKWITEAHGGTVCAESTPGSGTVFTFTFPQNK